MDSIDIQRFIRGEKQEGANYVKLIYDTPNVCPTKAFVHRDIVVEKCSQRFREMSVVDIKF